MLLRGAGVFSSPLCIGSRVWIYQIHPFSSGGIFQLFPVWSCYVARDILLHPLVHNCMHCLLGTHVGAGLVGHRIHMNSALWGPAQLSPPRTVPIYIPTSIVSKLRLFCMLARVLRYQGFCLVLIFSLSGVRVLCFSDEQWCWAGFTCLPAISTSHQSVLVYQVPVRRLNKADRCLQTLLFIRLHLVLKRRVDAFHSLSFHANQAPEKMFAY